MSKRPTFMDLINDYGDARGDVAVVEAAGFDSQEACRELEEAEKTLVRALRKAGLPLDQVAP